MKCTLVIPAYNEALVITETVQILSHIFAEQLPSRGHVWSIVVVDNASISLSRPPKTQCNG